MESSNQLTPPLFSALLARRVLLGLALGFAVISFLIFSVDYPNLDWGPYWRIRPLLVTPMAGACAGLFYHFMGYMRSHSGWISVVGWILSILGYFVALWMGTILGLLGTMWN
ncbi:MAG: potassium transporter KefB [Flavipsychrobacter sp.]|jgi:hypothetical protein|nr:potassium transporter KefB [Flavipsychrobacter sp.]